MRTFKEFQGKTLDEAIKEACAYFGVVREKLEIEIINDAKTGIFGLVGVKKAEIRAARVDVASLLADAEETGGKAEKPAGRMKNQAHTEAGTSTKTPGRKKRGGEDGEEANEGAGGKRSEADEQPGGKTADAVDSSRPIRPVEKEAAAIAALAASKPDRKSALKAEPKPDVKKGTVDAARAVSNLSTFPPPPAFSPLPAAEGDAEKPPRGRRGGKGERDVRSGKGKRTSSDPETPIRSAVAGDEGASAARKSASQKPPLQKTFGRDAEKKSAGNRPERKDSAAVTDRDDPPEIDLTALDASAKQELEKIILGVLDELVRPIVGEFSGTVAYTAGRVRVSLDCGESSGLLVGKEGQTLSAVQYIAGRIIAKKWGGTVRLQFDAGNYRERQDERLRELALSLAEKAKATQRSQSTRPLSAYQRRIVHLALETDAAVQTYSKGEGTQRRVIIQPV